MYFLAIFSPSISPQSYHILATISPSETKATTNGTMVVLVKLAMKKSKVVSITFGFE